MPETVSLSPIAGTSHCCTSTARVPSPVGSAPRGVATPSRRHRIRSRIGVGAAGGFYPAPHRYRLFLAEGCPRSLRISVTLGLLGLHDSVATTLLTLPDAAPDACAALRAAYEATWHHYDGPLTAPALTDRWSGRVVSNHTPDILRDLGGLPACQDESGLPRLHPPTLAADIDALRELVDRDLAPAARAEARSTALASLDGRLATHAHVLGDELTAADVDLWVALGQLGAEEALSRYGRLRDYVQRLDVHPAFRDAVRRT